MSRKFFCEVVSLATMSMMMMVVKLCEAELYPRPEAVFSSDGFLGIRDSQSYI